MGTDAAELMHGRQSADEDMVADGAMAAEGRAVGEHHLGSDATVMAHVAVGHVEPALAYLSDAAAVLRADVHRDALADVAARADHEPRRAAAVPDGLRRRSGGGEQRDRRLRAPRGGPRN